MINTFPVRLLVLLAVLTLVGACAEHQKAASRSIVAEKELFADDSIRASTSDVSDTTMAAASLTAVADSLLR